MTLIFLARKAPAVAGGLYAALHAEAIRVIVAALQHRAVCACNEARASKMVTGVVPYCHQYPEIAFDLSQAKYKGHQNNNQIIYLRHDFDPK